MPRPQDDPRTGGATAGGRRIDPATAHVEDLAAYLDTDLHEGLSPKEAEKRLLCHGQGGLFAMEKIRLSACIIPILKEPVMWLLMAVSVVACVFGREDVGIPAILLTLLHGVVCVLMNLSEKRLERRMQSYDVPMARVIRNRRTLRVSGDMLAVGDVILLRRGDVIPADARLLTSARLTVAEDTLDGDETRRETVCLEKSAHELPETVSHRHSPVNMVYAGGLVTRGSGRAVVTATGEHTHLGGLLGRNPTSHTQTPPSSLTRLKKRLSTANLILAVVALPVTAIGILTLGDRYDLLDLFATALALSVLTLTEHVFVLGRYLSASLRRAAADDPDPHLSCEIRSTETLETLRRMDHLVLMGTAALDDGRIMPESVLTCGATYTCGQSATDEAVTYLAEKMFLYAECFKRFDQQLGSAAEKMTAWAQPDVETLMLRLSSLKPMGDRACVTMKRRPPMELYLVPMGGATSYLPPCEYVRGLAEDGKGQAVMPLDEAVTEQWAQWISAAEAQGKRVLALVSDTEGVACAEGLIAFETETCPKTRGVLSAFMAAGIDVTLLLPRDDIWDRTYHLREAGLLQGRETPCTLQDGTAEEMLTMTDQGIRVIGGCTPRLAEAYVRLLREKGSVVGVFSVEAGDADVLSAADIAITCTPTELKDALSKQVPVDAAHASEPDGDGDAEMATDICRYTADVVVRRCSGQGGGVCGIRRALLTAEQMQQSGIAACRYIFLSQILRTVTVLLPLLMGLTVIPAGLLLFSGFGMDLLAFLCLTRADVPTELTSRRMEKAYPPVEDRRPSILRDIPVPMYAMIATAASCLIPWVAVLVAKLMSVSLGADAAYFGMLCLLGAQICLLITQKLPRRRRMGFFATVLAVCVYVGGLSVALGAQLSVLWCLLIPLIQPLSLFLALKICRKIIKAKRITRDTGT